MSRIWKYTLVFIAGFILLLISLMLLTQTAFFKKKAKIQLVKLVENQLNVNFEIGSIEGNWYNELIITDIELADKDSLVASLSMVKLNYQLLPLLKQTINIDSIIIEKPAIILKQETDSSWNINSFLHSEPETKPEKKGTFNFSVKAENIILKDGNVTVSALSKIIPSKTSAINLNAGGEYSSDQILIKLNTFSLNTENPTFQLKELSGIYKMDERGMQIDSLLLLAGSSVLDFNGEYQSLENNKGKISEGRIDKNDLAIFIPSFKLLCSPLVKIDFYTHIDSVTAVAELSHNNQSVWAELSLHSLSGLLAKNEPVPYSSAVLFNNVKVSDWIESKDHQGLINGNIQAEGNNLLDFKNSTTISGHLDNSIYNGVLIDTLTLSGIIGEDSVAADIVLKSDFGNVGVEGTLITGRQLPEYKAQIVCDEVNLTRFIPKLIGTEVNGFIRAEGKGFTTKDIFANANLNLTNSTVYNFPLDSLLTYAEFKENELLLDSIKINSPGAVVFGEGTLSLDSLILESSVFGDIQSLEVIKSLVELPVKFDSATTVTRIYGPVNALKIGGDITVSNAEGYASEIETAKGRYLVTVEKDSVVVNVNSTAYKVKTGPTELDSVVIDFGYFKGSMDIWADLVWDENFSALLTTQIRTGDTLELNVPMFEVKTILSDLYLTDTMKTRLIGTEKLEIENLRIRDKNREDFVLAANGMISGSDTNHFHVEFKQFDVSQLNRFIGEKDSLKGHFNGDITISGTSSNPMIDGDLNVENPEYGGYAVSSVETKFGYKDQTGFAQLVIPELGDSFFARVSSPFQAYIDSLKFNFNPPENYTAELVIDSLDLSEIVTSFVSDDSIKGILNGRVNASGEIDKPFFYGNLNIHNGQFKSDNLGIDYHDILTNIVFDGNKILIDTFLLRQKGGLISVTGEMAFDSTIIKGNVTSSSLQLDADKFFLTKHRNYEILIDANTFIKTGENNPEFGGNIKVIRSDIFLPALMSDSNEDAEYNVPMLVEALETPADSVILEKTKAEDKAKSEQQSNRFTDQLTGRLFVDIPKNTWIRSNDMRVELNGELEIIKTGPYFEIFGNIDVVRGYYVLYGRKLNITDSQIVFRGGEELDPTLNIETEYIYRGSDKEKRYLNTVITGELSEPEIKFILDGNEITETDGISILIFGATSDEIGYGAQNSLLGSVGTNAVTSIVTSQLSRTIGSQFNLDMIEVTATENWQSAAFVVGKYITNDLFVIYQRGFGEVDGDEITPETIILEYELNDKLFLRLQSGSSKESGMDVILKFEQELDRSDQGIKKE